MTTPPLQKLTRTRLSDSAAAEIKRLIGKGTYAPGTRLPTEADLAGELGVTRLTLREALFQLEALGLTTTRHGSGTYVVDFDDHATFRLLAELVTAGRDLTPDESLDLMQFRAIVVGGFTELLAKGARRAHMEELRQILDEGRLARGHVEKLAELDYRFNSVLAGATGNFFYTLLMRSLREVHLHLGAVIFRELRNDDAILAAQSAIVHALEAGDAAALGRASRAYLAGGTRIVGEWVQKNRTRERAPARRASKRGKQK